MADSTPHSCRPSVLSKRTHARQHKHSATYPTGETTPSRIIGRLIVGLGCAGLAGYLYHSYISHKLNPRHVLSIGLGSLTLGYGLFDLGLREGMIRGASYAPQTDDNKNDAGADDEDAWKGEFKGMEFENLKTKEKITWLKNEEVRVKEIQEEEQSACGKAFIQKEDAYQKYEKFGGYGGGAWKEYAKADEDCQNMYKQHERHSKRLRQIRKEINDLQDQI